MIKVEFAIERAAEFRLHPLGFFYLRLEGSESRSQRFHIWPNEAFGIPDNECHQHTFDIRSVILSGHMKSELFNFQPAEEGEDKEFAVEYKGGKSQLRPTGRTGNLERICDFDSKVGDSYFLRAGIIHRVSIIRRPCVTSLETADTNIPIFSYGQNTAEAPFNRRLVEKAEIQEIKSVLEPLLSSG